MKNYDAIIVDDEQPNINIIKNYLKRYCKYIQVKGEATTIADALELINKIQPKILFLDIQLQDETVFTLIDSLASFNCEIIFVSSYDQFAVRAIKYQAVDFVTKPIQINDLIGAVNRAVIKIEENAYKKEIAEKEEQSFGTGFVHKVGDNVKKINFIALSNHEKIEIIKLDDLIYCEADGKYTHFYLTEKIRKTTSQNLGAYEKYLIDSNMFFRIHHKYIVNLNKITNVNKSAGNYCELGDNIKLPLAKRRQESLIKFLGLK